MIPLMGALFLAMAGCSRGSYWVVHGEELNSATRFSMTYDRFNGYKEKDLTVETGEAVEIVVAFVSTEGTLDASICRKDDSETCGYEGNDVPTSTFTVTLNEPGTYVIRVEARRHSGSYSFHWN
ncbi:MAG TPA: hypothetical protein PLZ76_03840 [Bacillota bacterium]|nr:hypothetical protein [Bacillota bacterium]